MMRDARRCISAGMQTAIRQQIVEIQSGKKNTNRELGNEQNAEPIFGLLLAAGGPLQSRSKFGDGVRGAAERDE